jgi:hypothetical protein
MLLGAFRPQTTTEDKKVTNSERTRISYFTALTVAAYVVLSEENHIQLTEAANLYRKSGEAEGSAALFFSLDVNPEWPLILLGWIGRPITEHSPIYPWIKLVHLSLRVGHRSPDRPAR